MDSSNLEKKIQDDPSASNWLKEQVTKSNERDVLDALNDAEMLVKVLNLRFQNMCLLQGMKNDTPP